MGEIWIYCPGDYLGKLQLEVHLLNNSELAKTLTCCARALPYLLGVHDRRFAKLRASS